MPEAASALLDVMYFVVLWRNDAIAIWHLDSRQSFCIDRVGFLDDVVLKKQEGRQCIGLVRFERTFLPSWHGFVNEIKDRRCVGPVTSDREYGLRSRECALAINQSRSHLRPLARRTVAHDAFFRKDLRTYLSCPAARRQFFSRWTNRRIPRSDFIWGRGTANILVIG